MEILKCKGVSYWYPGTESCALENINMNINEGEFLLITGPSGCGKSTLVRLLNRMIPEFYGGRIKGEIYFKGKKLTEYSRKEIIKSIGMIYQHPEKQIVLQDVEREIAFGLENLNADINTMKRNVAEVMSFLDLTGIKGKSTNEISGGQKQRIAIASVIAMDPDILLFDEPTSQLDPIAAEEVLNTIRRLNKDMGKTVILIEQRLDRCFDMADRVLFMEKGSIIAEGNPCNIPEFIDKKYFLPHVSYIFKQAGYDKIPINIKQCREIIKNRTFNNDIKHENKNTDTILEVNDVSFEYSKGDGTLRNIKLSAGKGEIIAVMGENGAGKSTLFKIIAGLVEGYTGDIKINGKNIKNMSTSQKIKSVGYLSQNPNDYLGRDTVFEEVGYTLKNIGEYDEKKVEKTIQALNLCHLKERNPRDLSGGEKQRVAIACVLVSEPDILILDEPTRGMDSINKEHLGKLILKLSKEGKSVVLITHDADFAGDFADTSILMFNGEIVASGKTEDILYDSLYYSPQVAKVFKNKCRVVKSDDAVRLLMVM